MMLTTRLGLAAAALYRSRSPRHHRGYVQILACTISYSTQTTWRASMLWIRVKLARLPGIPSMPNEHGGHGTLHAPRMSRGGSLDLEAPCACNVHGAIWRTLRNTAALESRCDLDIFAGQNQVGRLRCSVNKRRSYQGSYVHQHATRDDECAIPERPIQRRAGAGLGDGAATVATV